MSLHARHRAPLLTRGISRFVFPLHERLKGHDSAARLRALEESQWWHGERLAEHRLARLKSLLTAARDVPYYRDVFSRLDFDPASVASLDDLARLPLLAKADIRGHDLRSERAGPLKRSNTGGSSGEPLIFYLGRSRISHDVAAKWRATRWWGVDIGDPEAVVWGSPVELTVQDRWRAWRDRLLRTRLFPAFDLSPAKLDAYVCALRAMRPRMLFGYPSALAYLARHAEAAGKKLDDIGVRVAFVTAERLYEEQRDAISRVFGCPVANGYGARDAGFIAHQCPAGGMHLSAEDIIVEIVDEAGRALPAGAKGEIVVTHLASADFPFIRYRTGDVGSLSERPCPCGRGLPLLAAIEGRSTDFVTAADGTVMHGLALIYVVRDLPGIRQFQIVQESLQRTRVTLVAEEGFSPAVATVIERGFKARLGDGVDVAVERVQAIAPERSGKFRYVLSHVAGRNGLT